MLNGPSLPVPLSLPAALGGASAPILGGTTTVVSAARAGVFLLARPDDLLPLVTLTGEGGATEDAELLERKALEDVGSTVRQVAQHRVEVNMRTRNPPAVGASLPSGTAAADRQDGGAAARKAGGRFVSRPVQRALGASMFNSKSTWAAAEMTEEKTMACLEAARAQTAEALEVRHLSVALVVQS